jgi:hypothetical protein
MVMSLEGLGPENYCAGEDQQELKKTAPYFRQRGCYIRTITANVQLKNKINGRESRRVRR